QTFQPCSTPTTALGRSRPAQPPSPRRLGYRSTCWAAQPGSGVEGGPGKQTGDGIPPASSSRFQTPISTTRITTRGEPMDRSRAAIVEKARAKRSRREAIRRAKRFAHHPEVDSSQQTSRFTEKVKDLTQEAVEKVAEALKATTAKIRGVIE